MSAAVGRSWPPVTYAVGREKVREFVAAVGETDPLCTDLAAARAAGFADLVAPPMFCVVYAAPAIGAAILDPAVGIDFARMVHGAQDFTWGELVVAGDEVTTTTTLRSTEQRARMAFFVFVTQSHNQHGATVCTGEWTNIVRGG